MNEDTIAAIATGLVPGGVGIVRVSGPEAIAMCAPLVRIKGRTLGEAEANHLYYSKLWDGEVLLDEALTVILRAPHSYTAEDTVELQCHGGPLVLEKVLEAVLKQGARPAEPGEFTKRAFLKGRLDLSEAEAVMDLIGSESEFARGSAVKQLCGVHSALIQDLRAQILELAAEIEAALDDPEHLSLDGFREKAEPKIREMTEQMERLIKDAEEGRKLAEGIETALIGRPNVGKSSLMNRLLGFDRAIVTDIPGTTRDMLQESLRIGDVILKLADTAGLREKGDIIERIGMERTREKAKESDLILLVLDGSEPLTKEDEALLAEFSGRHTMVLINKSDLKGTFSPEELTKKGDIPVQAVFCVSARTGEGIREVKEEIVRRFHVDEIRQKPLVITNLRHKILMKEAKESLYLVLEGISQKLPEDLLSVDLMDAYRSLGLIVGEEADEDLINEIFAKFCMGK